MKIIKLDNKDFRDLQNILSKINVSDIRDYTKITSLLRRYSNKEITAEKYAKGYETVINEAKTTLNNFKVKFMELYICDIINKKYNNGSIVLYNNTKFENVLNTLKYGIKTKLIPQNIITDISEFNTELILEDLSKLDFDLTLKNSNSMYNKNVIKLMNDKFDELRNQKTLTKNKKDIR